MLEKIKPYDVMKYFEEITRIPHGSGNIKEISDYLVNFARERGLEYHQDELNNVIIIKEGTNSCETSEPIILQGHIDMVCEKTSDSDKDMLKDGLDLAIDGDWLYAKGTSLGGDDGIAVAMMMAVLDSKELEHPRIEAIFTVDEEIGLLGAAAIDVSMLKGKRFINIDSEEEGVFTAGCAGGATLTCSLPLKKETLTGKLIQIKLSGLLGGHSGVEITKGRGNSNDIMGRLLYILSKEIDFTIVSLNGGTKENVIARETIALISTDKNEKAYEICKQFENIIKAELAVTDKDVYIDIKELLNSKEELQLTKECTKKQIQLLLALPRGIQAMSMDVEGLVETSLNLGNLQYQSDYAVHVYAIRSSVRTQLEMLVDRLEVVADLLGANIELSGAYPAWEYQRNSKFRDLCVEAYKEQYGQEPKLEAIHAGLECGMFTEKISGLEAISIGPDLEDVHSVKEKMSISSVERVWETLVRILKKAK